MGHPSGAAGAHHDIFGIEPEDALFVLPFSATSDQNPTTSVDEEDKKDILNKYSNQ